MTQRPDSGSSSENPRAYKSGPRNGSSQAPSYAELRNPTLTTSAISIDTNVTTSVPIMVRPWYEKWEQKMRQGSILFVHASDHARHMHTVADIPTLNYLLENAHSKLDKSTSNEYNITDFDEFKTKGFNLFGIMRNDLMAESNLQKLYNVDVFGRAMVANIFGKLVRGDHVGLALIEINTKDMYNQVFYKPDGTMLSSILIDGEKALQVVGTKNGEIDNSLPSNKILMHYPLGVVSHAVAKIPSQGQIKSALRNQDLFMLLPRIEILMI